MPAFRRPFPVPPRVTARCLAVGLLFLCGLPAPTHAVARMARSDAAPAPGPDPGSGREIGSREDRRGEGRVAAVLSGDTLRLKDGRDVRLADILAPRPARTAPRGGTLPAWPLAADARDALARLVEGKTIRLPRAAEDRYGRVLAHLTTRDGRWVQETLLRDGWALFDPHTDSPEAPPGGLDALRQAEADARAAGRGLWADPYYALRDPDTVAQAIGRFAVVRGRVISASGSPERVYINFGRDWRQDFTVEIDHHDLAAFRRRHIDPVALKGRLVEVRGWVESLNGPMIRVTVPAALTPLAEETAADPAAPPAPGP